MGSKFVVGDRVIMGGHSRPWNGLTGTVVDSTSEFEGCVQVKLDKGPAYPGNGWVGRTGPIHTDYLRCWSALDELLEWETEEA